MQTCHRIRFLQNLFLQNIGKVTEPDSWVILKQKRTIIGFIGIFIARISVATYNSYFLNESFRTQGGHRGDISKHFIIFKKVQLVSTAFQFSNTARSSHCQNIYSCIGGRAHHHKSSISWCQCKKIAAVVLIVQILIY